LQQEYFHTHKACSDLYLEIAMNMKKSQKTQFDFMPRVQKIASIQLF